MFRIRFWGVRGSIPTPGPTTLKVGGNTTCLEIRTETDLVIIDAGTGIRGLGNTLLARQPISAHMFFTHMHWDHIQGFPFFVPAFVPGNQFYLYGAAKLTTSLAEVLAGQMNYPNFPVSLAQMDSDMTFLDLHEDETVQAGDLSVTSTQLNHPGGVIAYRVDYRGKSVVFATDTEHHPDRVDDKLVRLAREVDVLVCDAMYTADEYLGRNGHIPKVGWGHSTWEEGVKVAREAGAGRLVLFHHDPDHDDEAVLAIEAEARAAFPRCQAAVEGLTLELDPPRGG